MQTHPLSQYIAAVVIVWVVVLTATWFLAPLKFSRIAIFSAGYFIGMLAMYIAVHVYSFR